MTHRSNPHSSLPALGRFETYRKAVLLVSELHRLSLTGSLREQLTRASQSVVLNLAEGAAQHSRAVRRRHYRIARASLWEVAAGLDLLACEGRTSGPAVSLLREVEAMLTALLKC